VGDQHIITDRGHLETAMFRRYYSLGLMAFWLVMAVCLLAPEPIVPVEVRRNLGGPLRMPAGLLALTFAVYNFVRWWSYRSLYKHRSEMAGNPLAVRKLDPDEKSGPYEPNPELDFFKIPDPDRPALPPAPPAEGDHRT
jgi:hypothetical protein